MSEKEAKIYLTVLELWSAPASTVARHAEEKRTTVYALLKKLTWEWTIQELKRKDISFFSVVSPELLLKHIESKTEWFKEIVPLLLELSSTKWSKPKVTYLEWSSWLEKLFQDFANSTVDMRSILWTPKYFDEKLLQHVWVYRRARKKNKLKTYRILSQHNTNIQELKDKDKEHNRESKLIDKLPFDINADINLYWPNKISFLFFDWSNTPHVLIIENQNMYQSIYSLFEFIRNHTKEI